MPRGTIAGPAPGGRPAATRCGATLTLCLDAPGDVRAQMARDAALLEQAVAAPEGGTLLRLFTFSPPGITLGRAQDPARELDLVALARDGVAHAVRPTGGRAIWHDEEWTFSLVTRLGPGGWAETPAEAYARTAGLFATALRALGVPVTLAPGSRRGTRAEGFPDAPRSRHGAAPPCFASTARHELLLEGRKLAGIAQRAVRGGLLQQGSILLGDSHARLARYVAAADPERAALAERWRREAAPAGPHLRAGRELERLAEALAGAFPESSVVRDGAPAAWPR